jgi:2,3-dimethylmalate lyase
MTNGARTLRSYLNSREFVVAPFAFDALQARIVADVGFQAVYMTGYGTAASYGFPDVGLLTMTEMVANAARMAEAVQIPLIADADTGYGNAITVQRTVREYERAGAAAIHIEDQVWPKKCGFFEGKQVIDLEEAVGKVRSALDARRSSDFVVIARTDALAVNGWDDAEERARRYDDAGADLIFVDGIRTVDDLHEYNRRLGDLPRLYNGGILPADDIRAMGFSLMITGATMFAVYRAYYDAVFTLKETGRISAGENRGASRLPAMTDVLGLPQIYDLERTYATGNAIPAKG